MTVAHAGNAIVRLFMLGVVLYVGATALRIAGPVAALALGVAVIILLLNALRGNMGV